MSNTSRYIHKCPLCGTVFYDEKTTAYSVYCSSTCANARILDGARTPKKD